MSPEEREKRRKFEQKRKAHYNEFYAVKMARQLMDSDDESEKDSEGNGTILNQTPATGNISNADTQSSATSQESSLDANSASTDMSNNIKDTKVNSNATLSKSIDTSEKHCTSSVPMDTTNSPSA